MHPGLAADPGIVTTVLASMNQPATAPPVVTGTGDMSAPVNVFVPYVVGQRGNSENYATYSSTLTASGSQSWTSGVQVVQHEIGLDEVIAVDPNGSITLRYTPSENLLTQTYTNPDLSAPVDDLSVLEGLAQIITYGPDRFSTSVVTEPGTTPTPAQQSLLADLEYSTPGASFPTAPANYRLVSVTGDQYVISTSVILDVATVAPADDDGGVAAVVGIAMTETLTGSL